VDTIDALYAVDQEDLSEKPVSAGFVSGPLPPKASFPVLPSQAGNIKTDSHVALRYKYQWNFKEIVNGN